MKRLLTALFLVFLVGCASQKSEGSLVLSNGTLRAVIADNQSYGELHRSGYNGISELYHVKQDSNLFVPFYAGFNLEHIFGGDSLESFFEPRKEQMVLQSKSNRKAILYQPATTYSKVESKTEFTLSNPHYVDVVFKFTLHDPAFFSHGYAGFFWASYINAPKDKAIYFSGLQEPGGQPDWLRSYSVIHGDQASIRSVTDTEDFFMADNFRIVLANSFSNMRYSEPFYYGRFNNMVFAYLFETPKEGVIRFAQSPTGGGPDNPAWDFLYLVPDYKVGKEYRLRVRMIYKEWQGAQDIAVEYRKWKNRK